MHVGQKTPAYAALAAATYVPLVGGAVLLGLSLITAVPSVAGMVAGALQMNGGYVRVPNSSVLDLGTGRKLWDVRSTSHVESSPAIAGDMVFCGAGADGLFGTDGGSTTLNTIVDC